MTSTSRIVLHLVYIHGFQGDHTTFQAFPTDLHNELQPRLSNSHPDVTLTSSLYPTYKTRRPLTEATKNFCSWLTTQPDGLVILIGHSMGGLLAAEAATSFAGKTKKIIGVVSFDTPFLGMHPHVVISGIASLFPQDNNAKSESDLNESEKVTIVNKEDVKKSESIDGQSSSSLSHNSVAPSSLLSPSSEIDEWEMYKSSSNVSLAPSDRLSPAEEKKLNFLESTFQFMAKHSEDRFVKFVSKHKEAPFAAMRRWVLDHLLFGVLMFEPRELLARYKLLEGWHGKWINYWTTTTERVVQEQPKQNKENDGGSRSNSPSPTPRDKVVKARHFITLPSHIRPQSADKWEQVVIRGVDDEVAGHLGMFIRGSNLEYDAFVARVAGRVQGWLPVP